jgi:hypothetical protein
MAVQIPVPVKLNVSYTHMVHLSSAKNLALIVLEQNLLPECHIPGVYRGSEVLMLNLRRRAGE